MRLKYWTYLVYFVALGLCPSCCCKKPPCPMLNEDEKAWLPHNVGDTIIYKSNSGKLFKVKALSRIESKDYGNAKPSYGTNCYEFCVASISQDFNYAGGDSQAIFIYYLLSKKANKLKFEISEDNNSLSVYFKLDSAKNIGKQTMGLRNFDEVYVSVLDTQKNRNINFYKFYVAKGYGLIRFENKNNEYYERVF